MNVARATLVMIGTLALSGCEPVQEVGWTTDPREARDPQGRQPLLALGDAEVADALGFASLAIDEHRAIGVQRLISALVPALAARGVDTSAVARIDDLYVFSAPPLASQTPAARAASSVGRQTHALGTPSEIAQYYDCPILAPEDNRGTTCEELVQAVVVKVRNEIAQNEGQLGEEVAAELADLGVDPQRFVALWANAAELYGAVLAAIYAAGELRAAGACDSKANAEIVSRTLGIEQGISLVLEMREWAIEQARGCVINTDQIAEQVRTVTRTKIVTFMEQHTVCDDADLSTVNEAFKQAEVWRREGIETGIDQQVEILRQELFTTRRDANCCGLLEEPADPPAEGSTPTEPQCDVGATCDVSGIGNDGITGEPPTWHEIAGQCVCCRTRRQTGLLACKGPTDPPVFCGESPDGALFCQCESIPLGSPLTIDLDGDGLELSAEPVRFDVLARGGAQRATWIGRREALLARDADGDGRIRSGAELFGNHSDCDGARCFDGVEALRRWDAPHNGGNGDGVIDNRDRVFAELRLWIDADGDAVSAPGELYPLSARGVRALRLDAEYLAERRPEGAISARLDVLTDAGARSAFDVWFRLGLRADQLDHLLPRMR